MTRTKVAILILLIFFQTLFIEGGVKPALPDSSYLQLLLKKLTVVGGALYIGAHPDDENTAALAYLCLGKFVRTGYLSLNRGEGGQNLIGPEQGDLLGVIRTQELLAARQIDHAEQFFTRAVDFGFSKSPDESLQKWGKENVLADVVWVIRKFQPDVIITRFPKEGGGHGHHTASAILAEEAFAAAADPSRFPEQLKYATPWQAKRIVWNRYSWSAQQQPTDAEKASLVKLDLGEYSPVLGKAYTELAGISRSNHKSQGFGDSEDRGRAIEYFRHTAGQKAEEDLFEGIDLSWKRIPDGEKIGTVLEEAYARFKPEDPQATIPALLKAYSMMKALPPQPAILKKMEDVQAAIQACAGLWLEAIAAEESVTPGGEIKVKVTAINRSHFPFALTSIDMVGAPLVGARSDSSNTIEDSPKLLPYNELVSRDLAVPVPQNQPYSQPYWLQQDGGKPFANVSNQLSIGLPELPAPFQAIVHFRTGQEELTFVVPVLYRWVDPVEGERYRNLVVVPEVELNVKEPVTVFAGQGGKEITVELKSGQRKVSGDVRLQLPDGWNSAPESRAFSLERKNQTELVNFTVTPSTNAASGRFTVEAMTGGKKISRGIVTIDYPHIPPQTLFPVATGKLVRVDLQKTGTTIGTIAGSGDSIPEALIQIGYQVRLLSDEDLLTGNLSALDSIVVGIRAYNTRPQLKAAQPRLLEYVNQGGTMVVQYNTLQDLDQEGLGPYPFRVSRDRVSVEEAPVTFLKPDHVLLNSPNKITQQDFEGWIQERGLYFPDQWDPRFETVLACNDPGEPPKEGGILYAHYGKGIYIYTGYSFFRELPAGVPGAYRLFVNLISARGQR